MSSFKGREEELNTLLNDFWKCAGGRDRQDAVTPQMTVIVAESGMGKSRLVQELYLKLSQDLSLNEFRYWPPKFGEDDNQIRTQPVMEGHTPKGPPQFIWLGARWSDPDKRNPDERQSILPHIINHIDHHIDIRLKYGPSWEKAMLALLRATKLDRDSIAEEGTGIIVEKLLDADVIPFGGLLYRVAKEAIVASKDVARDNGWLKPKIDNAVKTANEELLRMMSTIFSQSRPVPMVLWLDDAQWLDSESAEFLQAFWERAVERKWPLHIVITHWEQEWNIGISEQGNCFTAFINQHKTNYLPLGSATPDMLREYVREYLPNLTDAQDELFVAKAGGNFLSMIENMSDLLLEPYNFVNNDLNQPLNSIGEKEVSDWVSEERKARVEQRFKKLERNVKVILAWCSCIGYRFMQDIVRDFVKQANLNFSTDELLQSCVNPYAVLADLQDDAHKTLKLKEFRDKAYLNVARQHYEKYLKNDQTDYDDILQNVIRSHLLAWIENSVDEAGNLRAIDSEDLPAHCLQVLTIPEMIDFMALASAELALPDHFDPEKAEHKLAIQLHIAAIERYLQLNALPEVFKLCHRLLPLTWTHTPEFIVPFDKLKTITDALFTAGSVALQQPFAELLVMRAQQMDQHNDLTQRNLAIGYARMGDAAQLATACSHHENSLEIRDAAQLATARSHHENSLEIRKELATQLNTAESERDLANSFDRLGDLAQQDGDLSTARTHYEAAFKITKQLAARLNTPQSQWDLSFSLYRLGGLARQADDLSTARTHFEAFFEITKQLAAQQNTPESQQYLAFSFNGLGDLAERESDLPTAHLHFEAAFKITKQLAAQLNTPQSQRDLASSFGRLGGLALREGNLRTARMHYESDFEITKQLAAQLNTPQSQRDLASSFDRLGDLAQREGDLPTARLHFEAAFEITKQLATQRNTPENQHDLARSFNSLGELAQREGDFPKARLHFEAAFKITKQLTTQYQLGWKMNHLSLFITAIELGSMGAMWLHAKMLFRIYTFLMQQTLLNTLPMRLLFKLIKRP